MSIKNILNLRILDKSRKYTAFLFCLMLSAYLNSIRANDRHQLLEHSLSSEVKIKPNIIQILTDDQGWGDLRSYGHVFLKTPNIDRLASEGIKFTHCYSAAATCSPSRASILTGRSPYRNGIKPGRISDEPIIGSDIFPTVLDIAGISLLGITLDGTSILPLLEGREFRRPRPLYWRHNKKEFRIALREGDWKIVAKSDQTGFELFNLVADPRETSNQSAHEPEIFERMKKALIEYDNEVLKEGPDWWHQDEFVTDMPDIK